MSTPHTPHTPEPYRQECDGEQVYVTGSDGLERVCTMAAAGRGQRLRDSERIAVCVNFCQGVPNDQMHPGRLGLLIDKATQQDAELAHLRAERAKLREALRRVHQFWACPPPKTLKDWSARCDVMADCARVALRQTREDA